MQPKTILLFSADSKSREVLPRALEKERPDLAVEVSARITDALARLDTGAFDAAICCVDSADELAVVIRLKKKKPDLPVVMLSRVQESGFEALAESMGASVVVRKTAGLEATSKSVALALEMRGLLKEQRSHYLRTAELTRDVRRLTRANRKLVEMALGVAALDQRDFYILHVEDDPDQARLLTRAMARGKLPPFVRTVDSVDSAMLYLEGRGPYRDREQFPMPAIVISDLYLSGRSGLELVDWMRERDETRLIGVIMLTSSDREEDIQDSYRRGANLYVLKRNDDKEIVGVIREIYTQFMTRRSNLGSP
jgi:CheY-like chemotaxis protein